MNQLSTKANWTPGRSMDRRRARRVKTAVMARIRPYRQEQNLCEELLTATNLSRNGFYFVTRHPHYRKDMNLYAACPAGHSASAAEAEGVRVVRVEPLGGNVWGVAVAFLRSTSLYHSREISFQGQK